LRNDERSDERVLKNAIAGKTVDVQAAERKNLGPKGSSNGGLENGKEKTSSRSHPVAQAKGILRKQSKMAL